MTTQLALPAPPPRFAFNRESLRKILRSIPSGTDAVLSTRPGSDPILSWKTDHYSDGYVFDGRTLKPIDAIIHGSHDYKIQVARLHEIARISDDAMLAVTFEGESIRVETYSVRHKVRGVFRLDAPRRDLESIPAPDRGAATWTIQANDLIEAISAIKGVVPRPGPYTEAWPGLLGIKLETSLTGQVRLIAMSPIRFAIATIDASQITDATFRPDMGVIAPHAFRGLLDYARRHRDQSLAFIVPVSPTGVLTITSQEGDWFGCSLSADKFPRWQDVRLTDPQIKIRLQVPKLRVALIALRDAARPPTELDYWAAVILQPMENGQISLEVRRARSLGKDHSDYRTKETLAPTQSMIRLPFHWTARNVSLPPPIAMDPRWFLDAVTQVSADQEIELWWNADRDMKRVVEVKGSGIVVSGFMPMEEIPTWAKEPPPEKPTLPKPEVKDKTTGHRQKKRETPPKPPAASPVRSAPPVDQKTTRDPKPALKRSQTPSLTSDGEPPERSPCIDCGTTRGGKTTTGQHERSKGRCQSCYNRWRRVPRLSSEEIKRLCSV